MRRRPRELRAGALAGRGQSAATLGGVAARPQAGPHLRRDGVTVVVVHAAVGVPAASLGRTPVVLHLHVDIAAVGALAERVAGEGIRLVAHAPSEGRVSVDSLPAGVVVPAAEGSVQPPEYHFNLISARSYGPSNYGYTKYTIKSADDKSILCISQLFL